MVGDKGERFSFLRSIRQGCPLAPTLILVFVETTSSFLIYQDIGLRGLHLPLWEEDLLDAEFADDTVMYLASQEENLSCF